MAEQSPLPRESTNGIAPPATGVSAPTSADVFPDFAVSPEEVVRRTRMLQDYVRNHMAEGEDYGIMPGGSKPTLFKPGAEKLNAVYGLSPIVEVSNRHEDWDNGFVAYEVKVTLLNKRSGLIEAEGIGSCNSRERRYKNQDAAGAANTVLKMAKKRALVDATLSATRASGMFTQDLEDLDFEADRGGNARSNPQAAKTTRVATRPQATGTDVAAAGSKLLSERQKDFILNLAGRVFSPASRDADLLRLLEKPLEQLTVTEASKAISRLEAMEGH